ncbi:hypothetical protein LTR86_003264 [Recurvomyces mirabilis]|nr:hypothetical protein LTR86_003264 [Recurvomyces mirabilis]
MESSTELGSLQSRAEQLIRALIHNVAPDEAARRIVELATTPQDNPMRELFRANDSLVPHASGDSRPPEPTSHRSKFSLRFSRKDKGKASCITPSSEKATGSYQNVFQADVKPAVSRDLEIVKQNLRREGIAPNAAAQSFKGRAPSSSGHYNCVFCHTDYTTKGTCKRHIEEIHVAKRYFRCVMCRQNFATAPEARKHCQSCGAGVLGWTVETPEGHRIYSSEFETSRLFSTQQAYIVHLLELSAQPLEGRPLRSWHRKLRNLLEQSHCLPTVQSSSTRLFGSSDGWYNVRWEHERVKKAVKELEMGILDVDLAPHDLLKLHRADGFVNDLFRDRVLATTVSAESPTRDVSAHDEKAAMKVEEEEIFDQDEEVLPQTAPTPKRPLSLESSAVLPHRVPPGPPMPPPPIPHATPQPMHQPSRGSAYQYQYTQPRPLHRVPSVESNAYHVQQIEQDQRPATHHAHEPNAHWLHEQQPPPYENGGHFQQQPQQIQTPFTNQPSQIQTSFANHTPQQQNFMSPTGGGGYQDAGFMSLSELSMTSAMTSPIVYMQTQDDNSMALYQQAPPMQNPHIQQQQIQSQQQDYREMPIPHDQATSGMLAYSPMAFSPMHMSYHQHNGQGSGTPDVEHQQQMHQLRQTQQHSYGSM